MAQPLSSNLPWELANNIWAQTINPVIQNTLLQGQLISNISLIINTPKTINHGLNRMMIGWFTVDTTAPSAVWRADLLNTKTITLEANASTTIAIWVF